MKTQALYYSFLFFLAVSQITVFAQDKEESSRREVEVIKQIEAAGGRVMQISSADASREVSFYLAGDKIADEHLKDLSAVQNVIWLNLANTKVTDNGLKELAGMNLKKLHLEKTGIGDAGLVHLKAMADLEYLNIYSTKVSDAGLKHLEKLSKLKRLYVWNSKVTDAGMKALEAKIPGLKVVGESKLPVIKPPSKEEQLKKREKAVAEKEKKLNEKEAALKKREEAVKKKEQELKKDKDT